jgi:aldose 1-epimerase
MVKLPVASMALKVRPGGEQFELRLGAQRAVVTEVGATLREYSVDGRPIVAGFAEDEICPGARGQVLMPWPNRIADGVYRFADIAEQAPINDLGHRTAIHGLVRWLPWTPRQHTDDRVRLETRLHAQPGYAWTLDLAVEYRLRSEGLEVTLAAANLSSGWAPFGAGCHPYLAAPSGRVDDGELEIPADEYLEVDDRLIPTGRRLSVEGSQLDFRSARQVGETVLDNCFVPTARQASFAGTTIWWGPEFGYLQAFTGDTLSPEARRTSLALEPMTCPANAFQSGEGLIALEPEAVWRGTWGISPRPPG